MAIYHTCIFYPDITISMSAQTKENASSISDDKHNELIKHFPLLANEIVSKKKSKSDLTGGLDTFGQMSRMVEQSELGELMRVLPSFMEKPKDRVDITLWLYINYIRDLLGKEECTYEEVWDFYNIRVSEYEKKMIDKNMDEFIKENTGEE